MNEKVVCRECIGSGKHKKCEGSGVIPFTRDLTFRLISKYLNYNHKCRECNNTGTCPRCLGKGYVWIKSRNGQKRH